MNYLLNFKNNFIIKTDLYSFHGKSIAKRRHLIQSLFIILLLLIISFSFIQISEAQSLRENYNLGSNDLLLSLPNIMPLAYVENSKYKGNIVEQANAMDKFYQEEGVIINGKNQKGRIVIAGIYPFERSIQYVKNGMTDFHIPFLVNPLLKIKNVEKSEGFTYSSAIILYVVFAMYAKKDFADEIHVFESQIGKKLHELSSAREYAKFDEFLKTKKRKIGVDRAHVPFYLFKTQPMSSNQNGLKMVSAGRMDAYIHNMDECDMEIKINKIDSTGMEKINYKKFVVRMIVQNSEKGKRTDQIISRIIWGLQGRKLADVPLGNFQDSGINMEVPNNPYHRSAEIKRSKYYKVQGKYFNPVFTSKIPE